MTSAIDKALETNHDKFDSENPAPEEDQTVFPIIVMAETPIAVKNIEAIDVDQDIKDDYTHSRNVAASLLEQQQELIKSMVSFLNTCPSPRAFEVMNNMMKTADELGQRLLGVQVQLKEAQAEEQAAGGKKEGDTFIFTGGPSNILKALEKAAKVEKEVIEGEVIE
jgi:hypothetical protein